MRHRELWKLITESLEEFKSELALCVGSPLRTTPTPEGYIDDVIAHHHGNISSDEISFVRECFLGVLRYEHVCEGILQGFCDALKRNKQDRFSMYLIAYLFVYRFAEVTGRFLRSLMDKSTSVTRLAEYVGFLLDKEKMEQFAAPVLRSWYHDGYIAETIIGNIQRHHVEADRDVLQYWVRKATNPNMTQGSVTGASDDDEQDESGGALAGTSGSHAAKSTGSPSRSSIVSKAPTVKSNRAPTVAVAPKLSQSSSRQRDLALRQMPPHEVREMLFTIPPERPPRIEVPPVGSVPLDGVRPVADPSAYRKPDNPFIETERPTDRERLLAEKKAREEAIFQPDPIMQTRLQPDEVREIYARSRQEAPTVKQTAATIRREELLYRRRDEAREAELLRKAQEMRDDSEFQRWKEKQDEQERIERETRISERKLQMMLADEDAKAAKAKQEKRNAHSAHEFRRMMDAWRTSAAREASVERQRKQNFAEALRHDIAEQTEAAVRQVRHVKRVTAAKVKEESQANELKAATIIELERQRKTALIAEIKTVQQQSLLLRPEAIERTREARLIELGVMGTMSIEELKQKLVDVRQEHSELEEKRRIAIVTGRSQQRNELTQMATRCEAERLQYLDEKEKEREKRRATASEQAEKQRVVEEKRLIELQAKLQQKREERKALDDARKEGERQRKVEAMLLAGDAGAMEMKKWGEMERGVSNRIAANQNAIIRDLRQERTKQTMLFAQREANIAVGAATHRAARYASDALLDAKKSVAMQDQAHDDEFRANAIEAMRREKAAMRTRTA